jgi:23S rRNA (cytidine1920-2'-O)/16S rRNA (cytidine1409-2'-O)-methyltransferase
MTASVQSERNAAPPGTVGADRRPYVSRGGIKLANALAASGLAVAGRTAIDVGASTGGFTDCMLKAGASAVVCVDVGYGQLDWGLRNDPRVHVMERCNARNLSPDMVAVAADLAVIDVSFISLAKVLGAVLGCLTPKHDVLALVKPQFEVGRGRVGKGGVVRSAELRQEVLVGVGGVAVGLGESVVGLYPSGLPGPKGNRETFIWLAEAGRPGAVADTSALAVMAAAAELAFDGMVAAGPV